MRRAGVGGGADVGASAGPGGVALDGVAAPVPLIRDDVGGVLVGRAAAAAREVDRDETRCCGGRGSVVATWPGRVRGAGEPDGPGAGRTQRAVPPRAPAGRGSAIGRAVQLGGEPFTPVLDGVAHPRAVTRWAWYRHMADWLLVRPDP